MFQHFLVPLDGSHLAESSLTPARTLAALLGARITLLHVLEQNAPAQVHGDRHLTSVPEAHAYLREVAQQLEAVGLDVDYHAHGVAEGDVARSINQHARETGADLIVLSTHGADGMRDFMFGSIAQQVIGADTVPVLIVHPDAVPAGFRCQRLVVPLDGAAGHESSVPVARDLAQRLQASVHLVSVVPRRADLAGPNGAVGRLLPSTTSVLLDEQERAMAAWLQEMAQDLADQGVKAHSRVERGDPIPVILETLKTLDADLVVLSTHSKRGLAAFWSGSVAPRLLSQWRRPTLLVTAR